MRNKKQSINLRSDGSKNIGLGHLNRMKILFLELLKQKFNVSFVTVKNEFSRVLFSGIQNVYYIEKADGKKINKWPSADLYIVDLYEYDIKFYEYLKLTKCDKVFIFDDEIKKIPNIIDGVINHNIYASDNDYPETKFKFCGHQYFLLRDEFSKLKVSADNENILLCMGGSDPENQTIRLLEILRNQSDRTIDVVIGDYNDKAKFDKIGNNINLHINPSNIEEIMSKAKFAIIGAGTMAYELVYLEIPSILIVLADNQKKIAQSLENEKLAINLGSFRKLKDQNVITAIQTMETNIQEFNFKLKNNRKLIDGNGAKRLADKLKSFVENN